MTSGPATTMQPVSTEVERIFNRPPPRKLAGQLALDEEAPVTRTRSIDWIDDAEDQQDLLAAAEEVIKHRAARRYGDEGMVLDFQTAEKIVAFARGASAKQRQALSRMTLRQAAAIVARS